MHRVGCLAYSRHSIMKTIISCHFNFSWLDSGPPERRVAQECSSWHAQSDQCPKSAKVWQCQLKHPTVLKARPYATSFCPCS